MDSDSLCLRFKGLRVQVVDRIPRHLIFILGKSILIKLMVFHEKVRCLVLVKKNWSDDISTNRLVASIRSGGQSQSHATTTTGHSVILWRKRRFNRFSISNSIFGFCSGVPFVSALATCQCITSAFDSNQHALVTGHNDSGRPRKNDWKIAINETSRRQKSHAKPTTKIEFETTAFVQKIKHTVGDGSFSFLSISPCRLRIQRMNAVILERIDWMVTSDTNRMDLYETCRRI